MSIYIGVDPGKSGAVCSVDSFGNPEIVIRANETYRDIWEAVRDLSANNRCRAVIESVGAMPGQGVSSTFKFGESYGLLLGILTAAGVPFERISPPVWCKEFGLRRRGKEPTTSWKNRHKMLAQELFPDITITHATADALLMAEFCRRHSL